MTNALPWNLTGYEFNLTHAAGVTRYRVEGRHRTAGYYECVAIEGLSGSHHFIGCIQVMSRTDIGAAR